MIDLNDIRKEFSDFLANSPGARWRMDAAFAHVVQFAYEKGVNEKSEREVTLEREHAEFFERWHDERRKREALELRVEELEFILRGIPL